MPPPPGPSPPTPGGRSSVRSVPPMPPPGPGRADAGGAAPLVRLRSTSLIAAVSSSRSPPWRALGRSRLASAPPPASLGFSSRPPRARPAPGSRSPSAAARRRGPRSRRAARDLGRGGRTRRRRRRSASRARGRRHARRVRLRRRDLRSAAGAASPWLPGSAPLPPLPASAPRLSRRPRAPFALRAAAARAVVVAAVAVAAGGWRWRRRPRRCAGGRRRSARKGACRRARSDRRPRRCTRSAAPAACRCGASRTRRIAAVCSRTDSPAPRGTSDRDRDAPRRGGVSEAASITSSRQPAPTASLGLVGGRLRHHAEPGDAGLFDGGDHPHDVAVRHRAVGAQEDLPVGTRLIHRHELAPQIRQRDRRCRSDRPSRPSRSRRRAAPPRRSAARRASSAARPTRPAA